MVMLGLLRMLSPNRNNDNSRSSDQSPNKKADFAQSRVPGGLAMGMVFGAVVTGPGQERIAFVGLKRRHR
jgi:predicted phage tail protein